MHELSQKKPAYMLSAAGWARSVTSFNLAYFMCTSLGPRMAHNRGHQVIAIPGRHCYLFRIHGTSERALACRRGAAAACRAASRLRWHTTRVISSTDAYGGVLSSFSASRRLPQIEHHASEDSNVAFAAMPESRSLVSSPMTSSERQECTGETADSRSEGAERNFSKVWIGATNVYPEEVGQTLVVGQVHCFVHRVG
jgi:hypothetical protein